MPLPAVDIPHTTPWKTVFHLAQLTDDPHTWMLTGGLMTQLHALMHHVGLCHTARQSQPIHDQNGERRPDSRPAGRQPFIAPPATTGFPRKQSNARNAWIAPSTPTAHASGADIQR